MKKAYQVNQPFNHLEETRIRPELPPGIPHLRHLDKDQTDEVISAIRKQYPDLITMIRNKIRIPESEKGDEYLGDELVYMNSIHKSLVVSFDITLYTVSAAFSQIVITEINNITIQSSSNGSVLQ